jgi:hypothetical protein
MLKKDGIEVEDKGLRDILEDSDEDMDEVTTTKKKVRSDLPQYEPLQKLKATVRKRMVELAQMSCTKTRLLINKWFDEGHY